MEGVVGRVGGWAVLCCMLHGWVAGCIFWLGLVIWVGVDRFVNWRWGYRFINRARGRWGPKASRNNDIALHE